MTNAAVFRSLHDPADPLVLANAWDAASARIVAAAGARAVATTSAGVAWAHGVRDGGALSRDAMLAHLARVVAAVDVPVTADVESGFGATPEDVAATLRGVAEAGAVGVNLEDGAGPALRPVDEQVARIAAARAAAPEVFLNARIDTYLRGVRDFDGTVARAHAYLAAGASGIFVPGVVDPDTVGALAAAIPAPLNILAGPGAPSVAELGKLGVARVSLGSWVAEAAYGVARRVAQEAFGAGTYTSLAGAIEYGELQSLMSP
ncbi:isocitrate lyase/phosphoenolpyruvate mutase family protein [Dactylosporangium aurantiacum]|uniref:Isocitrate lyase/phosphoenolpyruvate mutase family protein n=1 Tax=Dactylosporangium aurantiacum TaxID=35754 RepID=A0A9Q9IC97_9ACTN|nr:isocitrate lyase/phosphoenolpyruvate mutase family protein [Dactylosporangium aurantiacum]MDG6102611.1 isocitrate lyase/phosphoenolpyruvate mutase family protein [Dactylosporangium aurantiacum]UWZ53131.1 isocitrate lyase/phosphoenolpyruvate mutase family protein [Dactylosporangium aurantiacum]